MVSKTVEREIEESLSKARPPSPATWTDEDFSLDYDGEDGCIVRIGSLRAAFHFAENTSWWSGALSVGSLNNWLERGVLRYVFPAAPRGSEESGHPERYMFFPAFGMLQDASGEDLSRSQFMERHGGLWRAFQNAMDEEECVQCVVTANECEAFCMIDKPSPAVLYAAVMGGVNALEEMPGLPSADLRKAAVITSGTEYSLGGLYYMEEDPSVPQERLLEMAVYRSGGIALLNFESGECPPPQDLLLAAARHSPASFGDIPVHLVDDDVIDAAVAADGRAIRHIEGLDAELFEDAIETYPAALRFKAFEEDWGTSWGQFCMEDALARNGDVVRFVPAEHLTESALTIAVKENGLALGLVPEGVEISEVVRLAAVRQNPGAFRFIERPSLAVQGAFNESMAHLPEALCLDRGGFRIVFADANTDCRGKDEQMALVPVSSEGISVVARIFPGAPQRGLYEAFTDDRWGRPWRLQALSRQGPHCLVRLLVHWPYNKSQFSLLDLESATLVSGSGKRNNPVYFKNRNYGAWIGLQKTLSEDPMFARIAIDRNPEAIQFFDDPSEALTMAAIFGNPETIELVRSPTGPARKMAAEIRAVRAGIPEAARPYCQPVRRYRECTPT